MHRASIVWLNGYMQDFFPFFIILLIAAVLSKLFLRMRVPWVVSLILGGMLFGPFGLQLFETNDTIDFLGTIGLVFLMFMAGLESKPSQVLKYKKQIAITSSLIGFLPAAVGTAVVLLFGYSVESALLIGIVFMSSAIAMLIPIFHYHRIVDTTLVKIIIGSTVLIDALSLLLLSVFLQATSTGSDSGYLLIMYPLVICALAAFAYILPKIKWLASERLNKRSDLFENELQFTVLILVGLVVFFEFVGLHAIIAGFFGGMILSRTMMNPLLKAKLYAISYGFFVPIFFVMVGASADISVFAQQQAWAIMASIIIALVASKFIAGWLAGKINGFNNISASFMGVTALPQLSTGLAVAFLGFGEGLLDQNLLSSIVGLTVVTSILSPVIIGKIGSEISRWNPSNKR